MVGYGQFCSVARAHEVLGGRWTLLVVRELLCGSRRFNDIRRGIPRISRTVLSERLQGLAFVGAVARIDAEHGPEYVLTDAGNEIDGSQPRFMLLKRAEASVCAQNPGFPEPLRFRGPLSALVAWWRGDVGFAQAQRMGLAIDGPRALARAFPGWFDRYQFAHIGPAEGGGERGHHRVADDGRRYR